MGLWDVITDLIKAKQDKKDSQVIVKNYISGNNTRNSNNKSTNKTTNNHRNYTNGSKPVNVVTASKETVSLEKIKLYCTGAKGKVYTTTFYKSINHNFGIEVVIKNDASQVQTVKLGHCIYDEKGNTLFKGTFFPKINQHTTLTENIFVDAKAFAKMKSGKYKSQFWLNDRKVQKVFFIVQDR